MRHVIVLFVMVGCAESPPSSSEPQLDPYAGLKAAAHSNVCAPAQVEVLRCSGEDCYVDACGSQSRFRAQGRIWIYEPTQLDALRDGVLRLARRCQTVVERDTQVTPQVHVRCSDGSDDSDRCEVAEVVACGKSASYHTFPCRAPVCAPGRGCWWPDVECETGIGAGQPLIMWITRSVSSSQLEREDIDRLRRQLLDKDAPIAPGR